MARSLVIGFVMLLGALGIGMAVGGTYLAGADAEGRQAAVASMLSVTQEAGETRAASRDDASIGQVLVKGGAVLTLLGALLAVLDQLKRRLVEPPQRHKEDPE